MTASGWWQSERFWRDIGPFLFPESLMQSEDEVDELLEELELDEGARVLDVGCGPGRILVPLTRRGFRVVGVDTCDQYRRDARTRARQEAVAVDVRAGDIWSVDLASDDPFDAVLDIFAVVGYHPDPAWDVLAVRRFYEALRPRGQLLIQTRLPNRANGSWKHKVGGAVCVERREWDRTSKVMSTTWSITSNRLHRVHQSNVRLYDKRDLSSLLEFCGFSEIRAYELCSEERIVVVAERPEVDRPFESPAS